MLEKLDPQKASLAIFVIATATIAGAWIFQFAGYDPCHLCLLQRWAYYFAVPFSLLLSVSAGANPKGARRGLYILAVVMLGSAIFGAYHAGVEWKWWEGPDTCSLGQPGKAHVLDATLAETGTIELGECPVGSTVVQIPPE